MRRLTTRLTGRRGYGLVEVAISCLVVAIAMSLTAVGIGRVTQQRQALERRQRATQVAMNALERFLRLPWPERTASSAKAFPLPESEKTRIPGAGLTIEVSEEAGPPVGRKVVVEVRWIQRSAEIPVELPLRLVAWTYRTGSEPQ